MHGCTGGWMGECTYQYVIIRVFSLINNRRDGWMDGRVWVYVYPYTFIYKLPLPHESRIVQVDVQIVLQQALMVKRIFELYSSLFLAQKQPHAKLVIRFAFTNGFLRCIPFYFWHKNEPMRSSPSDSLSLSQNHSNAL